MDQKIEETLALGGTQILLQGGHHPKLTKQWYLDLLAHIKGKFPQVNIHGFSPSEFVHFREVFNEPLEKIIADFKAAGLGSIPGGGGEILVDRVRQRVSPLKAMSDDWLEVMDVAHRLGLELVRHDDVRPRRDGGGPDRAPGAVARAAGQDRKGFTAFICWTFQAEHTKLRAPTVGAHEYLRTQALARIYLDNFPNVQSSWVTQGQEIGQVALKFGANDLGSIMIEENVVSQAGTTFRMTRGRHAPAHPASSATNRTSGTTGIGWSTDRSASSQRGAGSRSVLPSCGCYSGPWAPKTLSRMTSLVFQSRAMVMARGSRTSRIRNQKLPRSSTATIIPSQSGRS